MAGDAKSVRPLNDVLATLDMPVRENDKVNSCPIHFFFTSENVVVDSRRRLSVSCHLFRVLAIFFARSHATHKSVMLTSVSTPMPSSVSVCISGRNQPARD